MMASKSEIDAYFNDNYDYLLESIAKTKNKYKAEANNYDVEELMTYTYLHLIENKDKIPASIAGIQSFAMRYMTNQIQWQNSTVNKLYSHKKEIKTEILPNQVDDESDLLIKINEEIRYQDQKAILNQFYKQIKDKQQKIMFEVIFFKGIRTLKELTKHFGIARSYIVKIRKELYKNLNEYVQNNKASN